MPVRDAGRHLREALDSVLGQQGADFELIAVDDASADGSREILAEAAERDARVRIEAAGGAGLSVALNRGLARARGELVARMDADDVALPGRFRRQLEFLDAHRDVTAAGTCTVLIDDEGLPIAPKHYPAEHERIEADLLRGITAIAHPTAMVRRDALERAGGYREHLPFAQDLDLWLRLAEVGRLANLAEPLLAYRVHFRAVTHARAREQKRIAASIVAEACARRGIACAPRPIRPPRSERDQHARWARMAYAAGNFRTARKHSAAALRRRPWSARMWGLWAGSLRAHRAGNTSCPIESPH